MSGAVLTRPGETWSNVHRALQRGDRGLPGGESLAALLHHRRGARSRNRKGPLSEAQILTWAEAHYRRFKQWPDSTLRRVVGTVDESWSNIDGALGRGYRGLPGKSSLAKLLATHRGVPNRGARPPLSVPQILRWADAYNRRTDRWPNEHSGAIEGTDGETWKKVNHALRSGGRGLESRSSLAALLETHRGIPRSGHSRKLSVQQVLSWADRHHRRYGRWPTVTSGLVPKQRGESWQNIDRALRLGLRGLRGGSSLAKLLAKKRGIRNRAALPKLTVSQTLRWADSHFRRTGRWPTCSAGEIPEAPHESWRNIDNALRRDNRGLLGESSLAQLLAKWHAGL
jgi:hypothetical protein